MTRSVALQSLKRFMNACNDLWCPSLTEPEIERALVCSCMISSIGFDSARQALQVEFCNGHLYRVDEVPAETYEALMQAENFDRHYRENILGHFEIEKIGVLMPLGC
ncbi:MAG: KTSC domain-containing protein [Rhodobacteraceae bacterium]|nr:KTSC domain-containing protein [Paracoccaceae bacterium]